MRKSYVILALIAAAAALALTGCDALLVNAFKEAGLGQPDPATIQNQDAETLIQEAGIASGEVSDTFIQAVISDETTKNQVLATLAEAVENGTPEEAQAAQALILEIKLADIGADEVLDNLGGAIGQLLTALEDGGEEMNPQDIINTLLPTELADNPEDLASFIDNLALLEADIDTMADAIETAGGAVEGLDIASVAQTAVLVKLVSAVEPAEGYTTGEAVAQALEDLKNDPQADVSVYFGSEPDFASLAEDPTLQTLFEAAGLDTLLGLLAGN